MKYRSLSKLNHNDTSSVKFFFLSKQVHPKKIQIKYHIYKELRSRYRLKMQNLTSYVFPKMNIAIQAWHVVLGGAFEDEVCGAHCPLPDVCPDFFFLFSIVSQPSRTWMQDSRINYQFITTAGSWANCLISLDIYTQVMNQIQTKQAVIGNGQHVIELSMVMLRKT